MQIENLNESNVEDLKKKIFDLQANNPEIEFKTFPMGEHQKGKDQNEMLQLILDKLEALEHKVNYIFDGHVLIDGTFKKILA